MGVPGSMGVVKTMSFDSRIPPELLQTRSRPLLDMPIGKPDHHNRPWVARRPQCQFKTAALVPAATCLEDHHRGRGVLELREFDPVELGIVRVVAAAGR